MFSSLSRGNSKVKQAYICSSCLSNLLTRPPPAPLLPVDRTWRAASFYSTSTDVKPENNEASEPIETPKTQAVDGGNPTKAANAGNGNGAKKVVSFRKTKGRKLSDSNSALKALRKALADEDAAVSAPESMVEVVKGPPRKKLLGKIRKPNGKKEDPSPKTAKVKKAVTKGSKATKKSEDGKSRLRIRRVLPRVKPSFKSSGTDAEGDQDGTKDSSPPLARKVKPTDLPTTIKGSINPDDTIRLGKVARAFLFRNPSILQRIIEKNLLQPEENGGISVKRALVQLIQERSLSKEDRAIALQQLEHSIVSRNKLPVGRSIKSAMQSKAPLRRSVDDAARPTATRSTKHAKKVKTPVARSPGPVEAKPGTTAHEIKTIEANKLELVPIDKGPLEVPSLSYGLERVLFNPGVYHLQDPRSRVFNFDPYLQTIMPVSEFDFNALKQYITSSRDKTLISKAKMEEKKYTGSTSSMTSALAHFHFLLSQWRPINSGMLSKQFPVEYNTFTALQRGPVAVFLRWRDGTYAIDADKEYDTSNILMMLGKSMEKLLTLSTDEFEKYRKANSDQISEEQRNESEPFHYTTIGDFLLRSQLDAYDSRLPGTGMFDLKTRAVVSVRMDAEGYEEGRGYQILGRHGEWESFEREYYDMIRAAFLKYSLQVRMGRMDGIFVAFHNTERIFGFQYISLPEMDHALHGTDDTFLGDEEFKLSLELLNRVLDRATAKFPEKSLRLHFETRDGVTPFMYIFAEPVEEEEVDEIQATNKKKIEEFERTILGLATSELTEEQKEAEWAILRAKVEEKMEQDELGIESSDVTEGERSGKLNLDELSPEEQQRLDDLMSTTAIEEDGEEDDENDDLMEDPEENDEARPETEEGDEQESDEIVFEDADENLEESDLNEQTILEEGAENGVEESGESLEESDSEEKAILEESAADDLDESGQDLKENDLDERAITEGDVDKDVEEIHSLEDRAEEDDEDVGNNSNNGELDSPESEGEHAGLVEAQELTSDEISNDSSIGEAAAATSTAANTSGSTNTSSELKPLLAMTLAIRNKINGNFVSRPAKLKEHEKWAVEYALSEVPELERAHTLYQQLKARRYKALNKSENVKNDAWNNAYIENIKKLSRKGKVWREQQDKIEAEMPVKTLDGKDEQKLGARDRGVWQEGKEKGE